MFYLAEDENELLEIVDGLLTEKLLFVRIVDSKGEWSGTTLVRRGKRVDLEPGERAFALSWTGRFDRDYRFRRK